MILDNLYDDNIICYYIRLRSVKIKSNKNYYVASYNLRSKKIWLSNLLNINDKDLIVNTLEKHFKSKIKIY